jgi:hypothetical protein
MPKISFHPKPELKTPAPECGKATYGTHHAALMTASTVP